MSAASPDPGVTAGDLNALANIDLDSLSGPFVIGTMLAMFLVSFTLFPMNGARFELTFVVFENGQQGVTLHQGAVFWLGCRKSREPIIYMVIVAIIQFMDCVHTGACVNTIYQWTVRDYGDPTSLAVSPFSFMIEPVMAAVAATIVHLFYAHRILLISDGHIIGKLSATFISICTFVQLSFGAAVTSKIVTYNYQFERFIAWLWGACVWLGTLAAVDLVICVTYTYYLNKVAKELSGPFVHSTQMVMKVALVVLATNGASALVAVVATVLFGSLSSANWHAIPQLCLQKMVTLSLLVCLNARSLLSDMIGADPSFFHSHMKRQPLNFLGNPLPGVHNPALSGIGGGKGVGGGRSFIDLGGAGGRGTEGRNVFDVKIERSTEYHVNRTEETLDEKSTIPGYSSTSGASSGGSSIKDRKVFEEEIQSSTPETVMNRQPFARSESDGGIAHPYTASHAV
ncbi:hypothetical protein JCM5353_003430 [Sporobolomyces roseus]